MAQPISAYIILTELLLAAIIGSIITYRVLSRNPKDRMNQIFSLVVVCLDVGVIITAINLFFINLLEVKVRIFLYVFSHYIWIMGAGLLFLYVFILFKPKMMIKTTNQLIFILTFGITCFIFYFIIGEFTLPEGNASSFKWSFLIMVFNSVFFLFLLISFSFMSIKIHKGLSNPLLKRKVKFINFTGLIYFIILLGIGIIQLFDDPTIRLIWALFEGISVLAAIFLYVALKTEISKMEVVLTQIYQTEQFFEEKRIGLLFSHFDETAGPEVLISLPETVPEDLQYKTKKCFDLMIEDSLFEVKLGKEDFRLVNLYFEIPNPLSRGGYEMNMISLILDKTYNNELIHEILREYSHKIISIENICECFHSEEPLASLKWGALENILLDCFDHIREKMRQQQESRIVHQFKRLKW